MRHFLMICVFAVALGAAAPAARAELLDFSMRGADTASFTLDSHPTVSGLSSDLDSFYFSDTLIVANGAPQVPNYLEFYDQDGYGGFTASSESDGYGAIAIDTYGPTLFTGTISKPVFSPVVFFLTNGDGNSDILYITERPVSGAPEPSTWVLMVAGLGMIGQALRRRSGARMYHPASA